VSGTPQTNLALNATPDKMLLARARKAYAREARQAVEEEWIVAYLPMVRHIVQRVAGNLTDRHDQEDLISAGTLGLVKAARAFDASKDADFKTYAYIRIRGAIIDELRGRSFVPAAVHKQIRRIEEAYRQHMARTGRPPTDEELAECLEMSDEQMYRTLEEARRQRFLSIHGLSEEGAPMGAFHPADRAPLPDAQAERKELLENLVKAISELPERDRLVVLLYYERDLTMKEAARVLGVTESRFSQLHASSVFKLSMKLGSSQ